MDDAQASQAGETEQAEELEETKLFLVRRASTHASDHENAVSEREHD